MTQYRSGWVIQSTKPPRAYWRIGNSVTKLQISYVIPQVNNFISTRNVGFVMGWDSVHHEQYWKPPLMKINPPLSCFDKNWWTKWLSKLTCTTELSRLTNLQFLPYGQLPYYLSGRIILMAWWDCWWDQMPLPLFIFSFVQYEPLHMRITYLLQSNSRYNRSFTADILSTWSNLRPGSQGFLPFIYVQRSVVCLLRIVILISFPWKRSWYYLRSSLLVS